VFIDSNVKNVSV